MFKKIIIRILTFILVLVHFSGMASSSVNVLPIKCGGNFESFLEEFLSVVSNKGISGVTISSASKKIKQDKEVLLYDRSQKSFRMGFIDFSKRAINQYRIQTGKKKLQEFSKLFKKLENKYGIPAEIVAAFWAMETDFGAVQGNFTTMNSLATLAHDCRRSELFQSELFSALKLIDSGGLQFDGKGAWAGEIGQVQMLPADILIYGTDGNDDGNIDLKGTPEDAIATAYKLIYHLGWEPNEPWLDEVVLKVNFKFREAGFGRERSVRDWKALGVNGISSAMIEKNLEAILLLPQGHKGPSFLAYPNYMMFLKWNDSFIYTVTAAYLAKRLQGEGAFIHESPEDILEYDDMIKLQKKLVALGEDVGEIDGILGAKTRQAVRKWQIKTGFVADSWPTRHFLGLLLSL